MCIRDRNVNAYSGMVFPALTCSGSALAVAKNSSPDSLASNADANATPASVTETDAYRRAQFRENTEPLIPIAASGMSTTTTCTMSGCRGIPLNDTVQSVRGRV